MEQGLWYERARRESGLSVVEHHLGDICESRLRVVRESKILCRVAGAGVADPAGFCWCWLSIHLLNSIQPIRTVSETSSSAEFLFGI